MDAGGTQSHLVPAARLPSSPSDGTKRVLQAELALVRIGVALPHPFSGSSPLMTTRGLLHVGGLPVGSGWFFAPTGLLMTCEHVRDMCRKRIAGASGGCFVVCPYLGNGQHISWVHAWEADVLAHTGPFDGGAASTTAEPSAVALNSRVDAAVLRLRCELVTQAPLRSDVVSIPDDGRPIVHLRLGTSTNLQPLQDLFCLGFPKDGGLATPTPTTGSYSGRDPGSDEYGWLKYAGLMLGGHSGGPIVTADGRVVGWNVRGVGAQVGGLTHAKPVEAARECIEAALAQSPRAGGGYFIWGDLLDSSQPEPPAEPSAAASSSAALPPKGTWHFFLSHSAPPHLTPTFLETFLDPPPTPCMQPNATATRKRLRLRSSMS
jgi:hypothetical protein